jgi:hypothetical protein
MSTITRFRLSNRPNSAPISRVKVTGDGSVDLWDVPLAPPLPPGGFTDLPPPPPPLPVVDRIRVEVTFLADPPLAGTALLTPGPDPVEVTAEVGPPAIMDILVL